MKSQSHIPNIKHQIPKIQLLASGLVPLGIKGVGGFRKAKTQMMQIPNSKKQALMSNHIPPTSVSSLLTSVSH